MATKVKERLTPLEQKKRKAPKTHYVTMELCDNCESDVTLIIPKGIPIADFIKNLDCPYCGCSLISCLERR